ncbi:hypothetical protein KZ820_08325 [Sphingomonas sp. RRHST34]|uniref:Uncharacterized protein n=1 Tax=Sphingomonas citri TaxID=2862499 RepID=A0ABS7BMA9_9SPHN|nr:hypothetical protein [Sphingomonas citri]MBW6530739.1 hypothetical protein [Sphingomonas citri]
MKYIGDVYYLSNDEEAERLFPTPPIPISLKLSPDEKIERAFSLLEGKMREGLQGGLAPAIYIMSADCGTGKNRSLQNVLREWKNTNFSGGGAIVFVSTLAEIDANVTGSGLDRADYAVLTSDAKYKTYGAGRGAAAEVPVLFVSQAKVRKAMLAAGSFAAAAELHYKGRVRSLRVWDEGFAAAEGAAFDMVDLMALPSAFKNLPKADRSVLYALARVCADPVVGLGLEIPLSIADTADRVLKSNLKAAETPKRTLEALAKLAGSTAYLRGSEDAGWSLLGAGRSMPADIAPLFVLDASARLTDRYSQLPAHGFKVVDLDPALLSYGKVTVHWWDRAAGKTVLHNATERSIIFKAIADLANSKEAEPFLIVMAKEHCSVGTDDRVGLHKELEGLIVKPERVRVASWGRHIGTNEFRDIANVIIVSSYNYGDTGYDALALAASGRKDGVVSIEERRRQEAGAFMHNVYQAVCRGSARLRDGAVSGAADVYLIMNESDRRREQVTEAFPDCTIKAWTPCPPKQEKKHDLVLRVVSEVLSTRPSVTFKEVTAICGGSGRSFLTKIVQTERFEAALASQSIHRVKNRFLRITPLAIAA